MELNLWNKLSNNINILKNEFDLICSSKQGQTVTQSTLKTNDSNEYRQKRINEIFEQILEGIEELQGIKRSESDQEKADKELVNIFNQLKRTYKKNAEFLHNVQQDLDEIREGYLIQDLNYGDNY